MEITAAQNSLFSDPSSRLPIQTLGQEEFLKLLVTQMTSQDPLNPQKDTDFIAQMAQFSALEQSRGMQTDLARLREQQQILHASALLGKTVELQGSPDVTLRGTVSEIQIEAGTPKLIVNGQSYDLDQVLTISAALASNPTLSKQHYAQLTRLGR
jgi:flagellar basal-body rod modification protein FlgD